MNFFRRQKCFCLLLAGCVLVTLSAQAGNPLWNGAGSVTNNNFGNTNNWVVDNVPVGNSINNVPVGFGPLAGGATNTANCDASGNPQTWTFNAGTAPMIITMNSQQLGAAVGPDVFVNNSTNLQTITGTFRLFDITSPTTTRKFNAASGPLAIVSNPLTLRGDSSPSVWAIELGGSVSGNIFNCASFVNGGNLVGKNINLLQTCTGTWEVVAALPDLTGSATAVTVAAGVLTFAAANTYTGPTIVSNGATLNTVTISTGAGAYSVSNSATLGVMLASAGTSLTNSSLTLGTTGADAMTVNFNLGGLGNPTNPVINVTGALTINGNCTINVTNGVLLVGQFKLIDYVSLAGAGSFTLGSYPAGIVAVLSNNVATSSIDLVVTATPGVTYPNYWNGNVSAAWDIGATANWKSNSIVGLTYADGNQIIFDDTAAGNFAVTLDTSVRPASVTLNNSANAYSISGTGGISGSNSLTKLGSGVFTLDTANNYTGSTTVGGGALVLNNLNALPANNTLNITNGAVVQPKLAGTYTSVTTTLNGSSSVNGSPGGALDFHSGGATTTTWPGQINLNSASASIGSYGVTYAVALSGKLTGSGGLIIRPEGGGAASHTATFTLSNSGNNYAGSTTMQVGTAQ